jgi:tRNA pseudouridine38-40 synthase
LEALKSLRNWKLTIAYEGTRYAGFQKQVGAIPTIQSKLETAIYTITGDVPKLTGAGRTDAGVHARGQVVNFFSGAKLQPEQWLKALNSRLPEDLAITAVSEALPDFNARFSAKSKTYSYRIYTDRVRPIFNRNFVYYYKHQLNWDMMRRAADFLAGAHDFRSFQAAGSSVKTTVRTVNFCSLQRVDSEIGIEINADGFLYHMVRNIAGTLILVGCGKIAVDDFQKIIACKDRNYAGPTAPAQGLCLEEVFY